MGTSIKLRPHHILCLHGFKGLGYSEDFIKQMQEISDKIKRERHVKISFIFDLDILCHSCTEDNRKACLQQNSLSRLIDKRLKKKLKGLLRRETSLTFFLEKLYKTISARKMDYICRGCEWKKFGYCREGYLKKRLMLEKEIT
ncbi:MAG: DUF1284 domain-containing protein [Candidatus Coatesbacteria bacterium]|nr:DUF1284 domain-containing protein [Candidatus Coatesbacteria bacterium]